MDARRIIGGLLLAVAATLLAVAPRGCTHTIDRVGTLDSGRTGIEAQLDPSFVSQIGKGALNTLFRQEATKRDWLFWVTTDYEARLSLPPISGLEPSGTIPVVVRLPGRITRSDADTMAGPTALWALEGRGEHTIGAHSVYVRWWLIVLLVLLGSPGLVLWRAGRPSPTDANRADKRIQ